MNSRARESIKIVVANEIGWEKTLEIYAKTGQREAKQIAGFLKNHACETRLNEWAEKYMGFYNSSGWRMKADVTGAGVDYTILRCPCFDGFSAAGLSGEEINQLCRTNHTAQDRHPKTELPGANFTSKLKPKDGPCREKYTIPTN